MNWISLSLRRTLTVAVLAIAVVGNIQALERLPLAVRVVPP